MHKPRGRSLLAVLGCLWLVGCAHVAPYEREHLAHPTMDTEREKFCDSFIGHVLDAREGGGGTGDSAGGGCGCN